jgi:hypothetical protein
MFLVSPFGFLTVAMAAALLYWKAPSEAKLVPGSRMVLLAPALRMAVTAACAVSAHAWMSRSWGSFMRPKATWETLRYLPASCDHMLANCALVGPPWPMMAPFQRA